jgi:hypothetical protein
MDRSSLSLGDLNYWYSVTTDYHFSVADIIVLNTTTEKIETPYIFKRFPAFCYMEQMRDYGMRYVAALEFLDLINILKTEHGNLRVKPSDVGFNYDKKHPSPDFSNHGPSSLSTTARPF